MNQAKNFVTGGGKSSTPTSSRTSMISTVPDRRSSWADESMAYEEDFPSLNASPKRTGTRINPSQVSTLARRISGFGVVHQLLFTREQWNVLTFPTNSKTALDNAMHVVNKISEHGLQLASSTFAIYLNDEEYSLVDDKAMDKAVAAGIKIHNIKEAGFKPISNSAEVSIFNQLDNYVGILLQNIVILNDVISLLNQSSDIVSDIKNRLSRLPMPKNGFSMIQRESIYRDFVRGNPKLFTDPSSSGLLMHLAASITADGVRPSCAIHKGVKIVYNVAPARDGTIYRMPASRAFSTFSLSSDPVDNCIHCQILKLAVNESIIPLPCSLPLVHFHVLQISVLRLLENIGYLATNSVITPSDVRSTDHATVVNRMSDIVNADPMLQSYGIKTDTRELLGRSQRVILLNEHHSLHDQRMMLGSVLSAWFGDLNQWGYSGCHLVDQNGITYKFGLGLNPEINTLVAGEVALKKWVTESGINNILEFKTTSVPIYNAELVESIEKHLAASFEKCLNGKLPEDAQIKVHKNNSDSRFNFVTNSPTCTFAAIKTAVEEGEMIVEMLCDAILNAMKSDVIERNRDVASLSVTIVVKMKLNPQTETHKAKKDDKKRKPKPKSVTGNEVAIIETDQKPRFFISTPFKFELDRIRDAVEKSYDAVGKITVKKTNTEINGEVMNRLLKSFESDVNVDCQVEESTENDNVISPSEDEGFTEHKSEDGTDVKSD
ncbi:zinc-finger protein [Scaphoideus titanus reo-like virus 1]|nr:zinc-finger protein [Scaphoideus titanus reo-like virus 1]